MFSPSARNLLCKLPKSRFRRKDLDLPPKSLSPDALWSSFLLTTRFRCRKKSSRRRRNTAYAKSSKALSPRILVLSFAPLPKAKKWQSWTTNSRLWWNVGRTASLKHSNSMHRHSSTKRKAAPWVSFATSSVHRSKTSMWTTPVSTTRFSIMWAW